VPTALPIRYSTVLFHLLLFGRVRFESTQLPMQAEEI
jgi:hypothetical protein